MPEASPKRPLAATPKNLAPLTVKIGKVATSTKAFNSFDGSNLAQFRLTLLQRKKSDALTIKDHAGISHSCLRCCKGKNSDAITTASRACISRCSSVPSRPLLSSHQQRLSNDASPSHCVRRCPFSLSLLPKAFLRRSNAFHQVLKHN